MKKSAICDSCLGKKNRMKPHGEEKLVTFPEHTLCPQHYINSTAGADLCS